MRTREEQEAINKACKFHPTTKAELQELVNDKRINLGNVDTSQITDMGFLFRSSERTNFTGIEKWDVGNVTDMCAMFNGINDFNQPLNDWNVSKVKNMTQMFACCHDFNQPLKEWNISSLESMFGMFSECENFNQDISSWDVANVKDMRWMFAGCKKFNQSLNAWSVREDCDCSYAFCGSNLSLENVKEAFTKEQFLYCGSVKIIDALNNEKKQVEVQEQKVTKGRGR